MQAYVVLTVEDSRGHDLMLARRRNSHDSWNQSPSAHDEHAPSPTPTLTDKTADNDASSETDIVQAVEEGQP